MPMPTQTAFHSDCQPSTVQSHIMNSKSRNSDKVAYKNRPYHCREHDFFECHDSHTPPSSNSWTRSLGWRQVRPKTIQPGLVAHIPRPSDAGGPGQPCMLPLSRTVPVTARRLGCTCHSGGPGPATSGRKHHWLHWKGKVSFPLMTRPGGLGETQAVTQ